MVEKKRLELSIHPRNWTTGDGKVKPTAKPPNGGGRVRKKVIQRAIIRENNWAAMPETIKHGYRKPGSRNPTKLRQR